MATGEDDEELTTGGGLGPFTIGHRLGAGTTGVVFQALDTELERQVALKVVRPRVAEAPGFRDRFLRDVQAQASLDSPHLVPVHSFGEADGRLFVSCELIPDGDLAALLERHGPPPARVALDLVAQVADGLAAAHAAGLVHGDVGPADVLLRHRDHRLDAYLGGFGNAGRPDADADTGPDTGPDLRATGRLLWTTLTGHTDRPVAPLTPAGPGSAEIDRIVHTAAVSPGGYPSAAALRDDLRAVLSLLDEDAGSPATAATSGPAAAGGTGSESLSSAPPAPLFRRAEPTGPPQPTTTSEGHLRPSDTAAQRSRRPWIAVAVVAALLVGAVVLAALFIV